MDRKLISKLKYLHLIKQREKVVCVYYCLILVENRWHRIKQALDQNSMRPYPLN